MTGPGEGKLRLEAEIKLIKDGFVEEVDGEVYIHVKGYSRARVTHLDVESPKLEGLLRGERGIFTWLYGVRGGIEIKFPGKTTLIISSGLLNEVLSVNEKTRTWVGGKEDGIYVGFRREHVRRLEKIAVEVFNFKPR